MFVRLPRLVLRTLEPILVVTTSVGKAVVCKHVVCGFPVSIYGRVLSANLVVLPTISYAIILGMYWLAKHLAVINCTRKQVTLRSWEKGEVTYIRSRMRSLPPTILAI